MMLFNLFIFKKIDRIEHDENTIFCNFVGINQEY